MLKQRAFLMLFLILVVGVLLSGSAGSGSSPLMASAAVVDAAARSVYTPAQAAALAQDWVALKSEQIPQWQAALAGPPVVYYDLDGVPSAYVCSVFSTSRAGEDVGYITLSYEVREHPVLEFGLGQAPHLRDSGVTHDAARLHNAVLLESRPLFLGPLAYYFEAQPLSAGLQSGRRHLVRMGSGQIIEVAWAPRTARSEDTAAAALTALQAPSAGADTGATQMLYGVPDYNQFDGETNGYDFACASGCTPTAATNMALFWARAGYPNLDVNPANWRDTTVDLRTRMETYCLGNSGATRVDKASPGLQSFAQGRGYAFQSLQYCWPTTVNWAGCDHREFSWERYRGEIDQCRPVLISFGPDNDYYPQHSVAGVGYDTVGGNYYAVHDNWSYTTSRYTWVLHEDDDPNDERFLHTFVPPAPLDTLQPGPVALDALPAFQYYKSFALAWSAASDASPGVGGYDVEYRDAADGVWRPGLLAHTATSATLSGLRLHGGHTYTFRVRAADLHCNAGAWTVSNDSTADADPPVTAVEPQPRYRTATSFPVAWDGLDLISGIASYDVEFKGPYGACVWRTWQQGVTTTAAIFTGAQAGTTYEFRSVGTDRVGQREPKTGCGGDVQLTIARFSINGRVLGNRGQPALQARVSSTPTTYAYNSSATVDPQQGRYSLFFSDRNAGAPWVDLTARPASGQDVLPPMQGVGLVWGIADVNGVDLVLPPADNAMRDSHFETGDLPAHWTLGGTGVPTRTRQAHTGDYALLLGTPPLTPTAPGWWAISQTVFLSPTLARPTLSWMVAVDGTPGTGDALVVRVVQGAQPLSRTVPLTATGWQHAWLALDEAAAGRAVTVSFALHRAAVSGTLQVRLDEVTLGSGDDGPAHVFLPLVGRTYPFQGVSSDAYEPDDDFFSSTYVRTDGTLYRHTFHDAGDWDYVYFFAEEGVTYTIETSNLGPRCDTVLQLHEIDGGLGPVDDNGGGGLASRIVWTAYTEGYFRLGISHHDSTVYGAGTEYDVSIRK